MTASQGSRIQRTCEACGKTFWTWPSRLKEGQAAFCSRACSNGARRVAMIERKCEVCLKPFDVRPCYARRGQGRFCSTECQRQGQTTPLEERFRQYTGPATETGCLPWVGHTNKNGYGLISLGGRQGPIMLAHRLAYEKHIGPIPEGMNVLHHCDNPPCVNHEHLFLGTQTVNMADMDAKGRRRIATGEARRTAKLTEAAVREIRERRERDGTHYKDLALEYGVSTTSIRQIFSGRTWKHV